MRSYSKASLRPLLKLTFDLKLARCSSKPFHYVLKKDFGSYHEVCERFCFQHVLLYTTVFSLTKKTHTSVKPAETRSSLFMCMYSAVYMHVWISETLKIWFHTLAHVQSDALQCNQGPDREIPWRLTVEQKYLFFCLMIRVFILHGKLIKSPCLLVLNRLGLLQQAQNWLLTEPVKGQELFCLFSCLVISM